MPLETGGWGPKWKGLEGRRGVIVEDGVDETKVDVSSRRMEKWAKLPVPSPVHLTGAHACVSLA